jgi:hypothetical protein
MTDSLREALRQAAADGVPQGSDVTGQDLLQRGRNRARFRRISGTTVGGLALAALVSIPFVATPSSSSDGDGDADQDDLPSVTVAERPMRTVGGTGCGSIDDYEDWTRPVVSRTDVGTTVVLLSPDGTTWAMCIGDDAADMATFATGSRVADDPGLNWVRVLFWNDDCVTGVDEQVCSWGAAGQTPPDVARMTFESLDGRTSDATVREGFFAWQSAVDGIDDFNQPLWVTLYDSDGEQIDRLDANRNPDTW